MTEKVHDRYRKTRPGRLELTCSYEEKEMINELAKIQKKKRNQAIIDLVKEKLIELKEGGK